ncbi:putative atpase associated with various cellular activities aaa_3 protein [Phaeoacremonium minimum UCRPA7]|uniref:magnesium chelatase n=1 Tax=Phaeoacremonium minimum (strain UCR-PA7) TaxID=1286976 RepID=R8BIN2_PHAM7|nr:putative atpase associated with various cellular activities aaa_3 protein [Phaeoacremonium minimum UCRPA7]EON99188.1 putative atpase associated with various cellular activities aaa_3 protein [Phaeoacremonium minimum UCRPA7]
MADENVLKKVHNLSDIELAALLSLMSREHCLISTPPDALDDLIEELLLISTKTFGLKPAVVDCTPNTTLDEFATSLLLHPPSAGPRSNSPYLTRHGESYFHQQPGHPKGAAAAPTPLSPSVPTANIANVVLAKNLDRAPRAVQIQALELLRTKRIFTRTSVQMAPKQFLFVAVLGADSGGQARVTPHLNDFFYVAHWHDSDDGFANLDEEYGTGREDSDFGSETASTESVVKKSWHGGEGAVERDGGGLSKPVFSEGDIACLAKMSQDVQIDVDVLRYQMNIVSFLRMHRAVAGGITPTATRQFEQLMKCLAPLHRLDYVTPSLVALAARKIYLHRIKIVMPEKERSMQWGSELAAIEALLEDVGPEEVIEDVLGMVPAPV